MKITKLGHCCLIIETKGKRIMTDPGSYTTLQNEAMNIDLILITHEHPDHLHIESLETVLKNNPNAKIITNGSVGKILAEKGIAFEILDEGNKSNFENIALEAFGSKHEEIFEDLGMVENTGYFIDEKLFYPGDAYTDPKKPVDILAAPISAPWTNFKTAVNYILKIRPRVAFPVHDGMFVDGRRGPIDKLPPMILQKEGIEFKILPIGEEMDF
jgi:L-ascorbate metabolism protein UlaG (beta-lactamase superfamily)